jgi:hypothetical protein
MQRTTTPAAMLYLPWDSWHEVAGVGHELFGYWQIEWLI